MPGQGRACGSLRWLTGAVKTAKPRLLSAAATPVAGPQVSPSWPSHAGSGVVNGVTVVNPETRTTASG